MKTSFWITVFYTTIRFTSAAFVNSSYNANRKGYQAQSTALSVSSAMSLPGASFPESVFTDHSGKDVKRSPGEIPQSSHRNIIRVESPDDFKEKVLDEDEKIVVVRFFAPWCRACKAAEAKFHKLVSRYGDQIKFIEVPASTENPLQRIYGVERIPFGHIYYPNAGLVEKHSVSQKNIKDFGQILSNYVEGACNVDYS